MCPSLFGAGSQNKRLKEHKIINCSDGVVAVWLNRPFFKVFSVDQNVFCHWVMAKDLKELFIASLHLVEVSSSH